MSTEYQLTKGVRYLSSDTSTTYHTVDICEVNTSLKDAVPRFWIIYIHGGGWSDPNIQANSFRDIRDGLLREKRILAHVAGIAAVNYRLSGAPSEGRNARHPDHLEDVQHAIKFLDSKYEFGDRYILVGHSAGATLAFQFAMEQPSSALKKPLAILGASGIYDLRKLLNSIWPVVEYREEYVHMLESAFGAGGFTYGEYNEDSDGCGWDLASPAKATTYGSSWPNAQIAMLVHSSSDELVPLEQSTQFATVLESSLAPGAVCHTRFNLAGSHDDIWRKPEEMVRLILEAVMMLVGRSSS
ncbi:alpha/beta-hydrolase [Penicillium bovifimosum]|uniref:Kynurenine formamidase n=1 Tax=Penicillium bovifimosum TaxID=126998 RepID=A0A9W9HHW2_9EURO|nr:alpha/beta-hydrolase [Penicillium bovifimosum]KAJ5146145.1 alpha/beta-hydrolase [Penicillium bovifimosum]